MASWGEIEQAEPEFAAGVRQRFDAGRHKTIATLRSDGSPRISGIECVFDDEGELTFGSMPHARKGQDLKRDPRFALHGPTFHPEQGREKEWPGEAKIAGRARLDGRVASAQAQGQAGERQQEQTTAETHAGADMFVADITEVVVTHLNADATTLVVEWWTPGHGLRVVERD